MPKPFRRWTSALAAVGLSVTTLTACASVQIVDGHGTQPPIKLAPNANLPVKGKATGSCPEPTQQRPSPPRPLTAACFDTLVQNGLSDVMAFWQKEYPKVSGGKALPPLKGGLYSVDGLEVASTGHVSGPAAIEGCISQDAGFIVDNGAFCRLDDSIAWDRNPQHLFAQLADKYGDIMVALVFAHEFGHAISYRLGVFDRDLPTIDTESQADCAAGAWAASALANQDPHFPNVTPQQIDNALEGYLDGRDGTPASEQDISHGNGFDRLSAIADGIENGVTFCYSSNYFQRTFTERPFYKNETPQDNTPLNEVLDTSSNNAFVTDLNRFWTSAGKLINKTFQPVKIAQADHPPCDSSSGLNGSPPDSGFDYCPNDNTVYFNTTFASSAYNSLPGVDFDQATGNVQLVDNQPGDFALGTLFAMGWGLAVRHQFFSGDMSGKDALLAAACYVGAYAKDINVPPGTPGHQLTLSPGDLDEGTSAMLNDEQLNKAFGVRDTTGLNRIQAFIKGYKGSLHAC
jgi:predicted metalloprotease